MSLLLPILLLWIALRRRTPTALGFRGSAAVWLAAVGMSLVVAALLSPLTMGEGLSLFDRDFLRLASSFVLFPVLLFALLQRKLGDAALTPFRRRAILALALCGSVSVGFAGVGLAYLTVAVTGAVPTRALNRLLTSELAPMEAAYGGLATRLVPGEGPAVNVPVPESLLRSAGTDFHSYRSADPGGDVIELDGHDANLPAQTLRRVRWPEDWQPVDPAVAHYTADGEPPF
jgi:hypothetical protein